MGDGTTTEDGPAGLPPLRRGPARRDVLDEEEFYDLMQAYRHAPLMPQDEVVEAFENIKAWIRALVAVAAMGPGLLAGREAKRVVRRRIPTKKRKGVV